MNGSSEWWRSLYDLQHEVWPTWSKSSCDADKIVEVITKQVKIGHKTAIDLGAGVGREACALANLGWSVIGIELSSKLIEKANERLYREHIIDQVEFLCDDIMSIDIESLHQRTKVKLPANLLLSWDSTLAIWPLRVQENIIRRWLPMLNSGGTIVVGQLNRHYYEANPSQSYTVRNDDVGPGITRRNYMWDNQQEILIDQVFWSMKEEDENIIKLPEQRLHLLSAHDLIHIFHRCGLQQVKVFGSNSWAWDSDYIDAPTQKSGMIMVVGYLP